MRKRGGCKRALGTGAPMTILQDRHLRRSLGCVMDALMSAHRFRILTVADDFARECPVPVADTSPAAPRVVRELSRFIESRGSSRTPCHTNRVAHGPQRVLANRARSRVITGRTLPRDEFILRAGHDAGTWAEIL